MFKILSKKEYNKIQEVEEKYDRLQKAYRKIVNDNYKYRVRMRKVREILC